MGGSSSAPDFLYRRDNRRAKVAVVGLGNVAEQIHLPACALLPDVQIVAACEPDNKRRTSVGQRFGIPVLYPDAKNLLQKEKPDIVIIGTPPESHRDLCLLALQHGAHVFCEKPFVPNVADADEVIAAAEDRQRSVVVNNQYRFMKIYRVTQERIATGDFGMPFLIQCWQQMFHPPSREQNWRAQLVQSTLYEFGTHPLDLICFFFGALPLSITAHTPRACGGTEADVIVQATLRFPGERLATLMCNRISQAREQYLEMRVDCEKASLRISFGGTACAAVEWSRVLGGPSMRVSLVRGGEARMEASGRSRVIAKERKEGRARATALNLGELIDAIKNRGSSNDQARHARELIRIVCAGYESAQTGETVWFGKRACDSERARDISGHRLQ
jgi:predicted dehydrogenase